MRESRYERVNKSKGRGKRLFNLISLVCILGVSSFLLRNTVFGKIPLPSKNTQKSSSRIVSPLAGSSKSVMAATIENETQGSSGLQTVVTDALSGSTGSYGVYIKNLETGEVYMKNAHTIYDSASLYKLWIMAVVFQQIQNGKFTEDQTLSEDASTLNQKFDIDPGDAYQTTGNISYTVHDALHKMITISDNEAALLLASTVRLSTVATFLSQNNLTESTVGTNGEAPTTTPYDTSLFFQKLSDGDFANTQYTDEMITLLKAQALNEKIPKYLPDDVVIAHKTGELDGYSHDAGIIYADNGNYILVVMTETESPPDAVERIAQISKDVYNYFENNPSTAPNPAS